MTLETNLEEFRKELVDEINLFEDTINLYVVHNCTIDERITNTCKVSNNEHSVEIEQTNILPEFNSNLEKKRLLKRFAKSSVYEALAKFYKTSMPWGALTGIRPTKVAYDLIDNGTPSYLIKEALMKDFFVSEKKAELVARILKNQNCIIKNDNLVDLYIHIPFCPSRCAYCSFLSAEISKIGDKINTYVDYLIKEIRETKALISKKSFIVRSIYIGGGTPTVLNTENLKKLLNELAYPVNEFTVECGRPDTITDEKLDILKKAGVTRICINPPTFNDKTLKTIGRLHTSTDIIEAYKLALKYDFDVNMDLIAGLEGEKFSHFKKSLTSCLELAPANITVHTLAIKHGSLLAEKLSKNPDYDGEVAKMLDYSYKMLTDFEYQPYYLYRQKSMAGNLENVGYSQKGKICYFNIDSMEETCSILACGAGAISKRVFHLENRIERYANVKNLDDYLNKLDQIIEKKQSLFN